MKKAQVILLLILFLSSTITANAAEAEVDTNHIVCLESFPGTMTLGNLYLDCYLSANSDGSEPTYQLQVSYNGKDWKLANYKDYWRTQELPGECSTEQVWKVAPLTTPIEPVCFHFGLEYWPLKAGKFFLRLFVSYQSKSYESIAVPFVATAELISEQAEARAIDARNRAYSLLVKWPYKIPVGIPYKLTVQSKEKYSGVCAIRTVVGSPISYQKFNMKNGVGKTTLRGLKVGNARVNISCKQNSGSGPYASAYADVYFSK
jgi:hypothetical protein